MEPLPNADVAHVETLVSRVLGPIAAFGQMAPRVAQYPGRGRCLRMQGAVHTNKMAFSESKANDTRGRRANQGSNHSNAQKNVQTPDNEDHALASR